MKYSLVTRFQFSNRTQKFFTKNSYSKIRSRIILVFAIIFFGFNKNVFSQNGLWTWVHGSTTNANSVYGIKGVPDSSNAPTGLYDAVYWKDNQGKFWMYGGINASYTYMSDMWMFDPSTSMWTWVYGKQMYDEIPRWNTQGVPDTSNCPGARGLGSPAWTDSSGNLWMFGGHVKRNNVGYSYMNDLWKFDINTKIWTWMKGDTIGSIGHPGTMGVPDSLNNPQSLARTTAAWTDTLNNLYFHGGTAGIFGDVNYRIFKYNISTNMWTWLPIYGYFAGTKGVFSPTNYPAGRGAHTCWIGNDGHVWIYGGMKNVTSCCYSNQLWQYDPQINQWAWMSGDSLGGEEKLNNAGQICQPADSTNPGNSMECRAAWTDNSGNLWMYGGRTQGSIGPTYHTSTMWCWIQSKQQWMYTYSPTSSPSNVNFQPLYGTKGIPDPNSHPGNRMGTTAWKDNHGNFWMWGGLVETNANELFKNDMWMFSPDTSCLLLAGLSHDQQKNDLFEIYPNPASDKLFIRNIVNIKILRTEIINLHGATVFEGDISQNQEINISNLPIGLYFIRIKGMDGENYNKKFIISR